MKRHTKGETAFKIIYREKNKLNCVVKRNRNKYIYIYIIFPKERKIRTDVWRWKREAAKILKERKKK